MNNLLNSTENSKLPNVSVDFADQRSMVRSLAELRSGRRLEKITASIESFLTSQVSRLNESLDECKSAVGQNQIVQRIMADFEHQKALWEKDRQVEIQRLSDAGEKLIASWKQLEDERQAWLADRDLQSVGNP